MTALRIIYKWQINEIKNNDAKERLIYLQHENNENIKQLEEFFNDYCFRNANTKESELGDSYDNYLKAQDSYISLRSENDLIDTFLKKLEVDKNDQTHENKNWNIIPEYIVELAEKGHILSDRKTIVTSLEAVVKYLAKEKNMNITSAFLQRTFIKKDGHPYSKRSCEDVVTRVLNMNL